MSILTVEDILDIEQKFGNTVPSVVRKLAAEDFRTLSKTLHPDTNHHPNASKAMAVVNVWKDKIEKGETIKDDAGIINYSSKRIRLEGTEELVMTSLRGYVTLKGLKDTASIHFQKFYIPQNFYIDDKTPICPIEDFHIVPLRAVINHFGGKVPHEHVNWLVNRMLEFAAWLEMEGFVHAGLNPESIFVLPEQHGIVIPTFYHMQKTGQKLKSISGRYANFYPAELLQPKASKIATTAIDLELIMRLALYMLGNAGGLASSLWKTHNEKMLNFYTKHHTSAANAFLDHKELVSKEFEKKFHQLDI